MVIDLNLLIIGPLSLASIAILGIVSNRRNIIIVLISLEALLLTVNIGFIIASLYLDDILGQVFGLAVLAIAAAESSIGLAIIILYTRTKGTISIDTISSLRH